MARGRPSLFLMLFVVAPAGSCELKKACVSGATQTCTCPSGRQGVQVCDVTGQTWGACVCAMTDARIDQTQLSFRDAALDRGGDIARPDVFKPDACKPQCTGKVCGSDGCGGMCAPGCAIVATTICSAGKCVVPSLGFNVAVVPPPPFGPSLPTSWLFEADKAGTSVSCTVVGSDLRIKASNATSSFQIESTKFNPATCSLHQVGDFSAALLKPNSLESWGFLPPLQPAGVGKYPLNFDLDCKLSEGTLSGTFFFTVLYRANQEGTYVNVTGGKVVCEVK